MEQTPNVTTDVPAIVIDKIHLQLLRFCNCNVHTSNNYLLLLHTCLHLPLGVVHLKFEHELTGD